MNSRKIADAIEAKYPEPPAQVASPYSEKMESTVASITFPMFGLLINQVPRRLLNPRSAEYWDKDRAEMVGMPSCGTFEEAKGGQGAIDAGKEGLEKITAMYKENAAGPLLTGKKPIYADFIWVSFLIFLERSNPDWFPKLLEATGDAELHKAVMTACTPYMTRNGH